jgi:hypothetical protein
MSLLATASSALAQTPQETALARTLFQEGVALADRGDWVGAADRFGRAHSIKPTAGIAFNWARALVETGELLHARELLMTLERDANADAQLRSESATMASSLERRIAHVRIDIEGEPSADVAIVVDGDSWPRAALGVASPIDPGAHTVVCTEKGLQRARVDIELAEGERRDVTLRLRADESSDAEEQADSGPNDTGATKKPLYKNWMLWSAVGVVAVGAVVTGALLASSGEAGAPTPVMGNATPGVLRW